MKQIKPFFIFVGLLLALPVMALPPVIPQITHAVTVGTNGVLTGNDINFFHANQGRMTSVLADAGYTPGGGGTGSATNLMGNAIPQVKSLILNSSGGAFMATNNSFVLVRTNGDDGTGTVGNTNYPFATITNAIGSRTNLYVDIGPGTFAVTNLNLGLGISLVGSGTNQTFLTIDSSPVVQNSGLVVVGNNVLLQDFTIGTNVNAGIYYFPIRVNAGATNLLAVNINVIGDSDGIFAPNVNAKTVGDFYYCTFNSGFDCVQLSSALVGVSTNSQFSFYNCAFKSMSDTNFGVGISCISVSGAQILAKDCTFIASNLIADANCIIGYYAISGITVENNSYSLAAVSGVPVSATGSLWIRGAYDVTNFSGNANRSWRDLLMPNGTYRRVPLY